MWQSFKQTEINCKSKWDSFIHYHHNGEGVQILKFVNKQYFNQFTLIISITKLMTPLFPFSPIIKLGVKKEIWPNLTSQVAVYRI